MTSKLFDLSGRVAVVSGPCGMGRAMALALAEHGADLLLVDRNADGLQQTARQIESFGRRAVAASCDVANIGQIEDLFVRLDREFGRIDFLANVAGEGLLAPPEDLTVEQLPPSSRTWSSLRDQHGQLVSLASERGKFVIVTFLYTHCKNVCPIVASQLNQTLRDLEPSARSDVRVLAVSVIRSTTRQPRSPTSSRSTSCCPSSST